MRRVYIRFLNFLLLPYLFVNAPMGIYTSWSTPTDVIEGLYGLLTCGMVFVAEVAYLSHSTTGRLVVAELRDLCAPIRYSRQQREMLHKTHFAIYNFTRLMFFIITPGFIITIILVAVIFLLPNHILIVREWQPFDIKLSPGFELALFKQTIVSVALLLTGNTLSAFGMSHFVYCKTLFKILRHKIANCRQIAVKRLRKRKSKITNNLGGCVVGRCRLDSLDLLRTLPEIGYSDNMRAATHPPCFQEPGSTRVQVEADEHSTAESWDEEDEITEADVDGETIQVLRECVILHNQLLRYKELFWEMVYMILNYCFLFAVMTPGVNFLLLTTAEHIGGTEVMLLGFSVELMGLYFLYNYLADSTLSQIEAVTVSCYFSDWYDCSPQLKKNLLLMMTVASHQVDFKPPGIEPLSLRNYSEICNLAYKMIFTLKSFLD